MSEWNTLGVPYKGYFIDGGAHPAYFGYSLHRQSWHPIAEVLLIRPDNTCLQVERYTESTISCDDKDLTKHFALFLAELAVDYFLPPPAYYLRPMDFAWAMEILSRAAEECTVKEIRRSKFTKLSIFLRRSSITNGRRVNTGGHSGATGAMPKSSTSCARSCAWRPLGFNERASRLSLSG